MELVSFKFVLFVSAAFTIYHLNTAPAFRRIILALINGVFVTSYAGGFPGLFPLFSMLVAGYLLIQLSRGGKLVASAAVIVFICFFIYIKQYTLIRFLPPLPFPYAVVGMSYILFRILHIVFDTSSGAIKDRITFLSYFNYTCFFLAFVSGPIQRYEDFCAQERNQSIGGFSDRDVIDIFSRIINGYIKIVFVSGALEDLHRWILSGQTVELLSSIIIYSAAAACYTVYLYMNFSGYMDVVIGIGKFFGFNLPENFNRPFASESFLEFWSRWHITLSNWIKFYIFNPLLKALLMRFKNRKYINALGMLSFFLTFFVMGIWHGSTEMFLILGFLLGFGASANKFYELRIRGRLGTKGFADLSRRMTYKLIARGFTFAYVSFCIACFWMDFAKYKEFLVDLNCAGIILFMLGLSVAASFVFFCGEMSARLTSIIGSRCSTLVNSMLAQQMWLSAKLIFVTYILVMNISQAPEFVYKGF